MNHFKDSSKNYNFSLLLSEISISKDQILVSTSSTFNSFSLTFYNYHHSIILLNLSQC